MVLAILLVGLLTVSAASATDNTSDIVSVEETTDEIVSVEDNNQTIDSVTDGNDLLSANSDGTFADLAKEIANATGELKLTKNYVYDPSRDSNINKGITIDKEIIINGRGFVIDGDNQARAFNILSDNVILRNIKFTNCRNSSYGGAIFWNGTNGSIYDCNFVNCYSQSSIGSSSIRGGGAIFWNGTNGSIYDCNFVNCYIYSSYYSNYGGAVYWWGNNGNLINSSFERCYIHSSSSSYGGANDASYSYGGSIYWHGNNGNMINSSFKNCYCKSYSSSNDYGSRLCASTSISYGGVVYWQGLNGFISNCIFVNCSSSSSSNSYSYSGSSSSSSYSQGGSIFWEGANGSLLDCSFVNCSSSSTSSSTSSSGTRSGSSSSYGGSVYWKGNKGSMFNCSYINSYSSSSNNIYGSSSISSGRAVYWMGNKGNMFNSSFNGEYYNYQEFCNAQQDVSPVFLIHNSALVNDGRILIFEITPVVNNISVFLYDVTDKITLYKQFSISCEDLVSSFTVNDLAEGEYQIVLEYAGDKFYTATSANDLFKIGKNSSYEVSINDIIDVGENVTLNLTLNEDATGKVKLTLSNYTCIDELVYGKTSFNIPCKIGEINEYKIKYIGDDQYNPIYINNTFIVLYKSYISLDLKDNYVFDENIPLNYNITPNCTGNIGIYVDDVFIESIPVGEVFELENISAGEHNVAVIYDGGNYFVTCNDSVTLTVSKADPSIEVNSYNLGDASLVEVILNEKATGKVTLTLNNNKKYSGTLINGKANITVSGLTEGNYTGNISYTGNSNYNPSNATVNVIIKKLGTSISASDVSVVYGDVNGKLVATLSDINGNPIAGADVSVILNNAEYSLTTGSNGQVSVSTSDLTAGSYVARITYDGDNKYEPSSATVSVVVKKLGTSIFASDVSVVYGNVTGELVATLTDVDGNPIGGADVSVILNNAEYSLTTGSNGQVSVSTGDLAAEYYVARITYDGDNNYNHSSVSVNVVVKKLGTSISASDVVVSCGDVGGELIATLSDVNDNPMANEDVLVVLNNVEYSLTTGSDGQVSVSTGDLAAGSYVARITYDGNNNYDSSTANAKVTVKANIYISASFNADTKEVVAILTNNATGMAIGGADVQVNLNGATTTVKTNSKGQAKVSTANLPTGTYTATISYEGNNKYNPATTTLKVAVKTDIVISASFDAANSRIVATLTNKDTGKTVANVNVDVKLNGETNTVKSNSKGQVIISTSDLKTGTYTATISYAGNSKYNAASTSISFATKIDTIISAVYDDSNSEIVATLTNAEGKALSSANVKVSFNGETDTIKTNSKGQVKVSTAGLALGTYPATFSYAGNSKYNAASASINVEVKTKVIVTDVYAYENMIVAKLTNGATGKFIANANMIVEINGVKYNVKSDNKGQLTFNTTDLNLPSSYDLTISYRGNDRYTASSATVAVDLSKANMMITTNYHADKQKMVATLKNSKTKKLVSNANMIIDLNGDKTTYKSDKYGKITLPTAEFAPGIYVGTVTYGGNARYNSISAAFKVEI